MPTVDVETAVREVESENERVLRWRVEELVRAGYGERFAHKLAQQRHVDLHEAIDLLRRGCEPELAVQILA